MANTTKRTRKRRGYFYEQEEKALVDYLNSNDDNERNRIYNTYLKPAFNKMTESIINRYKLYPPDENFQETFNDALSFMVSKIDHFDPSKGTKGYSYCGTIIKNYLIYKLGQFQKKTQHNIPYDTNKETLSESEKFISSGKNEHSAFLGELISGTCQEIQSIIDEERRVPLTQNEIKVGKALIELMTNWEDIFTANPSRKFNKSAILLFLKEATSLTTPEIRSSMRKYKKAYEALKKKKLDYL